MELTLLGKSPDFSVLENLIELSDQELNINSRKLVTESSAKVLKKHPVNYRHSYDYSREIMDYCLENLPKNHRFVNAIVNALRNFFEELVSYDAKKIFEMTNRKNTDPLSTPIPRSFHIVDVFSPEEIFLNVERAAYHILNQSISNQVILPSDKEPIPAVYRGMAGYCDSRPLEVEKFADFSYENSLINAYLINMYSQLGKEKSIDVLARAMQEGVKSIDYRFVAIFAKKELKNRNVSEEVLRERIVQIQNENIREKIKNYFN